MLNHREQIAVKFNQFNLFSFKDTVFEKVVYKMSISLPRPQYVKP